MQDYQKARLPKFTRFSIEAGCFLGALLGAVGCLILWEGRVQAEYLMGGGLLLVALLIQTACHKALSLCYSDYFDKLGQGLAVLTGLLILFLSPLAFTSRVVLVAPFFGLAYCLYRGLPWAQKLWNILTLLLAALGLFLFFKVCTLQPSRIQVLVLYLSISLIFTYGMRRWRGQPKPAAELDDLEDLWRRGRLLEIFRLPPDFTKLTLAEKHTEREQEVNGRRNFIDILENGYAILLVNETQALYKKSRQIMDAVQLKVGKRKFRKMEAKIWQELWAEIQLKYPLQPELLTPSEKANLTDKYARRI